MAITQQSTKKKYDLHVRVTTMFQLGDWVLIDRPYFAATSDTGATPIVLSAYTTLIPRSVVSFWINAIRPHLLVIHKHRIDSVVPIDRATRALSTDCLEPVDIRRARPDNEKDHKNRPRFAKYELDGAKAG